ncbi:MAG: hypothetical protein QMC36_06190 [Patescibacteria group bacterium]
MALKIDSPTLSLWNSSGIKSVRVRFITGGCAGTKVSVTPADSSETGLPSFDVGGISAHFEEADREKLDGARLTRIDKNGREVWMYSAATVK